MSSSTLFNGTSRYSQDFQSVIDRSVAIASLPLQQMKAAGTTLSNESVALSSLDNVCQSLQSAIDGLATAAGSSSYGVSTSDDNVTASLSGIPQAGTYTVEVTNPGSYTSVLSLGVDGTTNRVKDPSQSNLYGTGSTEFTLRTNFADPIIITASTLNDLVDQINAKAGADVQATLVDVGSTDGQPNYRLYIQSGHLRDDSIQLSADGKDLMSELQGGHPACYKVNGADEATSDSRTVQIAPGVTVNLEQQSDSGVPTTITVTRSTAAVERALNSFASAYNAVIDELDKNRGSANGALSGQSIVFTISNVLRQISGYQGNGNPLGAATSLGLELDKTGHLSLNTAAFESAAQTSPSQVMSWIGDASSSGFVQSATGLLNSVEDDGTGFLKSAIRQTSDEIDRNNSTIDAEQSRIDDLQQTLQERMSAADAMIASLEQQATYITNLFDAMNAMNDSQK